MAIKKILQSGSRSWQCMKRVCKTLPRRTTGQAGVTLIEMIVVVGIIAIISSVIIFNYSDFSSNVSLRNLSQEMALTIRKAQTYATSVHTLEGLNGTNSRTYKGYGISFALDPDYGYRSDTFANERQFVLFADASVDGIYNPGTDCISLPTMINECLEKFSILTTDKIVELCAFISGVERCYSDQNNKAIIDITYRRPSPDANICFRGLVESPCVNSAYAKIKIRSIKGLERYITVYNTGQISVE